MPGKQADLSPVRFLQVVADPQRWALMCELARSDRRVGELSTLVGRPQNLVSYHLGELRSAGLIAARRSAADGRDTYYRIELARCGEMFAQAGAALHPGVRLVPAFEPAARPRRSTRPRVLFLCTGNSARSQIAEALIEHRSAGAIDARSAGSHPKPLHPHAVRVMAERGIDISHNTTKHFRRFARYRFDQVVTLCDKVREVCPDLPGQPVTAHWSMPDPSSGDGDAYQHFVRAADEIERRVELLIACIDAEQPHRRSAP